MTYHDLDQGTVAPGPPEDPNASTSSVADKAAEARGKAGEVAQTAQSAAGDVAAVAKDQARAVTHEAKDQVRQLIDTTGRQVSEQAEERTQQVSQQLGTLADQLQALAEGRPDEAGPVAEWSREIHVRVRQLSNRLEHGGVQGVARDLSTFARRRPLVFLAACMTAGIMVGRLVKDVAGADGSGGSSPQVTSRGQLPMGGMDDALPPPGARDPLGDPEIVGTQALP